MVRQLCWLWWLKAQLGYCLGPWFLSMLATPTIAKFLEQVSQEDLGRSPLQPIVPEVLNDHLCCIFLFRQVSLNPVKIQGEENWTPLFNERCSKEFAVIFNLWQLQKIKEKFYMRTRKTLSYWIGGLIFLEHVSNTHPFFTTVLLSTYVLVVTTWVHYFSLLAYYLSH